MTTKAKSAPVAARSVADIEAELAALPAAELEALHAGDEDTLSKLTARRWILDRQLVEAQAAEAGVRADRLRDEINALQTAFDRDAELAESYDLAAAAYDSAARKVRADRLRPAEQRLHALTAQLSRLGVR